MSYKPGSISSILGASGEASNSLSNIFSEKSIEKFARAVKPIEFKQKKVPVDLEIKKTKKPKHKHSPPEKNLEDTVKDETIDNSNAKRTIFVGNIPISADAKTLTKYFKEFGEIDSVRLRSLPVAGTAVDENGNVSLVKKVCAFNKNFGDQKGSLNAYIVYKNENSVNEALQANNRILDGRHLRVDKSVPTLLDPKLSVFVGALHYYSDEELLRNHFAEVYNMHIYLMTFTNYSHICF